MPAYRSFLPALVLVLAACSGGDGDAGRRTAAGDGGAATVAAVSATGFTVAEVQMARTYDSGGSPVTEPATLFAPGDHIEAVILTEGDGGGRLAARWRFGHDGPVFHEEAHRVDEAGVHAFRIAKGDGFPAGGYQVDILLDDEVVVSRRFEVGD